MTTRHSAFAAALCLIAATGCNDAPDDTIVGGSTVVDATAQVTVAGVLTLVVTPRSNTVRVASGAPAPDGNATITITGKRAATKVWAAVSRKSWTTMVAASGRGSGTATWRRSTAGLPAGIHVDTITITASGAVGSPDRIIDSLVISGTVTPPPPPPPPPTAGRPDLGLNASLNGRPVFPASDPWNQPIDQAPVDPNSAAILTLIGLTRNLHPDFGANWNGGPFGIPYVVVPDDQPRLPVSFMYADESDVGPYPIPANPPVEPGGGDQHILMITRDEFKLFELFAAQGGPPWSAGSGAIFDLVNGTTRPAGWTSADAAGLPIFPGLVRYDEVYEQGVISHAIRFTVAQTRRAYVAPARHWASSSTDPLRPPMGMRVRLKASVNIAGYPAPAQVILRALKTYGMIVADNGSSFFMSGTADARWDDAVNNTLKQIKVSDFEVILMTGIVQ